jgi:hypothetical protein
MWAPPRGAKLKALESSSRSRCHRPVRRGRPREVDIMRLHGHPAGRSACVAALAVALSALAALPAASAAAPSRTLHFVKARTLQGTFVATEAVWADSHRIYLASLQGKLFVLARDRKAGFPTVQVIQVSRSQLTAVRGDASHVYVLASDGTLRVYRRHGRLVLQRTRHVFVGTTALAASLAVLDGRVYVGSGPLAVDRRHAFLEAGTVGAAYDVKHLARRVTYAGHVRDATTNVYDRASGRRVAAIHHAPGPGMLYVDDRVLAIYGDGAVTVYDPRTFRKRASFPDANGVGRQGRFLITDETLATVNAFDLNALPAVSFSSVDILRELGLERFPDAIHLYGGLWTDTHDGLVFVGGSEFNPFDVGFQPAFFVLELR